jgi:hypothetical protein
MDLAATAKRALAEKESKIDVSWHQRRSTVLFDGFKYGPAAVHDRVHDWRSISLFIRINPSSNTYLVVHHIGEKKKGKHTRLWNVLHLTNCDTPEFL